MNPQRIFVNELSVTGQASNEYIAGELIGNLAEVLQALSRHLEGAGKPQALTSSATLSTMPLIRTPLEEVTFWDCLFKRRAQTQQSVRGLVQKLLTNGPHTEELLAGQVGHQCKRQRDTHVIPLSGSSIAAAAALQGWVVSLRDCDDYPPETLVVTFDLAHSEEYTTPS